MTTRFVDLGWSQEIDEAVRLDSNELIIVSPFIKLGALRRILSHRPKRISVITRFDLAGFADGVSDISALRELLKSGATVRGVKNLHAKMYLFGSMRAIVTSANLTEAALVRNQEFGLVSGDPDVTTACRSYFESLWHRCSPDLANEQLTSWDQKVMRYNAGGGRPARQDELEDFGAVVEIATWPAIEMPGFGSGTPQAFVKFLGEAQRRVPPSFPIIDEIRRAGCHWAVAYPMGKRPRAVGDDAVIFIGRLSKGPNDIRVFGRARGMRHVPGRDDATTEDVALRSWKQSWPHYIRVHHAEFIAGTMAHGISLNDLMSTLGSNSFASTQRNATKKFGNIDPRHAYKQQAAVELSREGFEWLNERLNNAFNRHGRIPQDDLDMLDWPQLPRL